MAKRFQRGQLLLEFEDGFKEVAQFFYALQYLVRGKHQQLGIIFFKPFSTSSQVTGVETVGWSLARSE